MPKTIIAEGKTTTEAIEKGLKELKTSKENVDIKVLEQEDKRSFFSILAPRVVKVEMTLKENEFKPKTRSINKNPEELAKAQKKIEGFLNEFISKVPENEITYNIHTEDCVMYIDMQGKDINYLIGYRGEVLNALQVLVSNIANKNANERINVSLNIQGYREKREKALEELAEKISKTVMKTGKSITLEPMNAYERKIIHSKLQGSDKVKTYSIGEEPRRKVVVAKK